MRVEPIPSAIHPPSRDNTAHMCDHRPMVEPIRDPGPVDDVLTPGQQALLKAMPALTDIHLPQVRDTIPTSNYIDPARFEREMKAVFRRQPVLAAPSSLIGKAREYVAIDIAGMPVLVTRTKDGAVNAFANVCRHRGMKLC